MSKLPLSLLALAVALLFAASAFGCGEDGDGDSSSAQEAPSARGFPSAGGRSLEALLSKATRSEEIVVSPAGQTYEPGINRFSFGVFAVDGSAIPDADVALYAAPGPEGKAVGPFRARIESLETEGAYASATAASEGGESVTVAYVTGIDLNRGGEWRLIALVRRDGELLGVRLPSIRVGPYAGIPDVGSVPPRVHTPTFDEVPEIAEIDTRIPPDSMHEHDLADVLGKRPVVLLFATPALCMSRVCGPVVDIAEQVHAETPDEVAFIHMEVYNDNDPNRGIRPQLAAYGLQTEPWLFVIDRSGKVSTRIEGPFSAEELAQAVERVRTG